MAETKRARRGCLWIVANPTGIPPMAQGVRYYALARELVKMGWTVEIIGSRRAAHAGIRERQARRQHFTQEGIGITLIRAPHTLANGPSRVAGMAIFAAMAVDPRTTKSFARPDVVLGGTVDPLAAAAGGRLASRHKVPFIYEIRDLWPETLIRLGRLTPKHPAAKLMYRMERSSWTQAAMVVGPLPRIPDYGIEKHLPVRPFTHVPNGVDLNAFGIPPQPPTTLIRLGYFGSHGLTDHLDVVLKAMATQQVRDLGGSIELNLYGTGPHKQALQDLAVDLQLTNVKFHDPLPRPSVPPAMHEMAALVFPLADNGGLYRYGACPNKLAEYMAAGRPVILNAPFAPDPVLSAGGMLTVETCDPTAWADAICRFAQLPVADRIRLGEQNRSYAVAHSSFKSIAERLDAALLAVMATR